ncbi:ANL family adenylate-forming protein [Vibrio splendidus]|uniref:ANL family adenylate-forming protein n=1 Tax=Vibrio splendidus TaxID=29497 RepID=UPI00076A1DAD|nr:fatty acid--CoA ligase family protein [Vibrio splendidus]PHX05750.1 Long-chain-fatty-acid--CoA ligase [Vibrio splendidus]
MSWMIEHLAALNTKYAIVDSYGEFSYAELSKQTETFYQEICSDIEPGQVVVLLSDYNYYSIALLLALLKHKAIIVPIVSNNEDEIAARIKVANCDWLLHLNKDKYQLSKPEASLEKHQLVVDLIEKMHSGLILFSSGSTGEPKAMIHDFDHLVNSFQGKKNKNLNMLVFLMFDHIGGLNTLLNTLAMGARVVLPANRNPDYIGSLIEKYKVNVLPSTPTFLNMLLMAKANEKYNLKSLKMVTYGTETMPESVLLKLKEAFPRARLMQTFGTSETGIAQTTSKSSDSLEMKLDDPNTEYKIVNSELWLRSKTQVLGYLNADMSSFTEDGWFQTGDLVEQSEGGYIKIVGRSKEVINVGGEKVLPNEVESVILELDIVDDCMVYSEKNAITGQMVAVQLVLHENVSEKDAKKLIRNHCRARLDKYKVPARFKFSEKTNFGDRFKKLRLKNA